MSIDLSQAYTNWANTEPVTVTLRRAGGVETSIAIGNALRRALSIRDRSWRAMTITGSEIVWNIPHAQLGDAEIRTGDTITDSSATVWQVMAVERLTLGSRWRCVCQKQRM